MSRLRRKGAPVPLPCRITVFDRLGTMPSMLELYRDFPIAASAAKAAPEPALKPPASNRSVSQLKKAITLSANADDITRAADELGGFARTLTDMEALGFILRYCNSMEARRIAISRLMERLDSVGDVGIIKLMIMNSNESQEMYKLVDRLSPVVHSIDDSFLLIHIASWAKSKEARLAAVYKLKGKKDALNVVFRHGGHDDAKELAGRMLEAAEK